MNAVLRGSVIGFIILCVLGLTASVTSRVSMRRNRDARNLYYATVVEPAEARNRQLFVRESPGPGTNKVPSAIAPVPELDSNAIWASRSMFDAYDRPYYRLASWKLAADSISVGSALLVLYCLAALRAIKAKESGSNPPL
jgi:hypothetical protein